MRILIGGNTKKYMKVLKIDLQRGVKNDKI